MLETQKCDSFLIDIIIWRPFSQLDGISRIPVQSHDGFERISKVERTEEKGQESSKNSWVDCKEAEVCYTSMAEKVRPDTMHGNRNWVSIFIY